MSNYELRQSLIDLKQRASFAQKELELCDKLLTEMPPEQQKKMHDAGLDFNPRYMVHELTDAINWLNDYVYTPL